MLPFECCFLLLFGIFGLVSTIHSYCVDAIQYNAVVLTVDAAVFMHPYMQI